MMQVVVDRSALLEVLTIASGIIASRTPKDILKCVRLTATKGHLLLSATDLEVGLRVSVPQVDVSSTGETLAPADKLVQITRESIDNTLSIEADEDKCHIRGKDSHFEIFTQDPAEFPPVPDLEGEADLEIDADVLHGLIERTAFSVAKENTRYAISGLLWEKSDKDLTLVGTDGRRLAWACAPAEKISGEPKQQIVPAKTATVLGRILAHVEGPVAVQLTENQVLIRGGPYVLSSSLVEGHFPQYREVVPKDNDKKVELSTEEFLSGVRRAALLTNEQSKGVRLAFEKDKLVLSSRAPEQGEATIEMPIDYQGEPIQIGFNPVFLTEALRVVGAKTVTLELKDANRPGVLRAGEDFFYVVMPVSLA